MHSPDSTSSLHRSVGITGFYIQLFVGIETQVPTLVLIVLCSLDVSGPPALEKPLPFDETKLESLMPDYKRPQNDVCTTVHYFPSPWLRKISKKKQDWSKGL